MGTVRVVDVQRCDDEDRLELLVQGVARAANGARDAVRPYARADVLLLPDSEALVNARAAAKSYADSNTTFAASVDSNPAPSRWRALSVAVADDEHWRSYEFSVGYPIEIAISSGMYPSFCVFNVSDAEATASGVTAALTAALQWHDPPAVLPDAIVDPMGASRAHARAFEACDDAVHAEAEEDAEAAAVECDRVLADLELQVWLELMPSFDAAWNRGTIIGGAAAPAPVQLPGCCRRRRWRLARRFHPRVGCR